MAKSKSKSKSKSSLISKYLKDTCKKRKSSSWCRKYFSKIEPDLGVLFDNGRSPPKLTAAQQKKIAVSCKAKYRRNFERELSCLVEKTVLMQADINAKKEHQGKGHVKREGAIGRDAQGGVSVGMAASALVILLIAAFIATFCLFCKKKESTGVKGSSKAGAKSRLSSRKSSKKAGKVGGSRCKSGKTRRTGPSGNLKK